MESPVASSSSVVSTRISYSAAGVTGTKSALESPVVAPATSTLAMHQPWNRTPDHTHAADTLTANQPWNRPT